MPENQGFSKNGVLDKANDRFELTKIQNEGSGFQMFSKWRVNPSRLRVFAKIKDNDDR